MTDPAPVPAASFIAMYRCEQCGARVDEHASSSCEAWFGLSPLFAWALWASLEILGDQWWEMPGMVEAPTVAGPFMKDAGFRQRMKASAHHLADEIARGHADPFLPRCTADEVNLAMALERARALIEHEELLGVPPELASASCDGLDEDYTYAYDAVRQDCDVEMLWNMELDGIENDEELLARIGTAQLHPRDWFEPFLHVKTPID